MRVIWRRVALLGAMLALASSAAACGTGGGASAQAGAANPAVGAPAAETGLNIDASTGTRLAAFVAGARAAGLRGLLYFNEARYVLPRRDLAALAAARQLARDLTWPACQTSRTSGTPGR